MVFRLWSVATDMMKIIEEDAVIFVYTPLCNVISVKYITDSQGLISASMAQEVRSHFLIMLMMPSLSNY